MSGKALIEINTEALGEGANLDSLIEAASAMVSSTEKDFEAIKQKVWYKRLWELVTFSQDNKKCFARGVGSLAQMQDIVIKMIVLLSKENPHIAELAEKNQEAINEIMERLNLQQDQLLAIKKALSHAVYYYRIKLSDIPVHDRRILYCAIYKYILSYPENGKNNDPVNTYFGQLKTSIGFAEIPDANAFDFTALGELENKKSDELYFTIISELTALIDESCENNQLYNDAIGHISISGPKQKQIWQRISDIVRTEGKDSLVSGYFNNDLPLLYIDTEYLDFFEDNADQSVPVELEDYVINAPLHILAGQEKKFYAKRISLLADINCGGTLILENCLVSYNDKTEGQIRLNKNAKLIMQFCSILGDGTFKENKNKHLISGDHGTTVLEITNSSLTNCMKIGGGTISLLKDCIIRYTKLPESKITLFTGDTSRHSKIENCLVEYLNPDISGDKLPVVSFGWVGTVANCTFRNIAGHGLSRGGYGGMIHNGKILKNNHFENCAHIFSSGYCEITDCFFEKCFSIICMDRNYYSRGIQNIERCQFVECKNNLILDFCGTIENCEFYNIDVGQYHDGLHIWGGDADKKNHKPSYIRHCIFNGINITENYPSFIDCAMNERLIKKVTGLYIDSCTFKNCSTKGTSDHFIDTKARDHNGSRSEYTNRIVQIYNCFGLDIINKEGSKAENIPIRHETGMGDPIGARLDDIQIGVPGYNP